jgi:excinuclease ABC subunit C
MTRLRALARSAPQAPGVYIMRSSEGEIIYVGKAKVLRNRLSSYFSGRKDVKTRHLVSRIESIEWILAASEYEALLLENTLIKKHTPKYNINLKDGKSYPSVRVTNEDFPRIFRTRRIIHDGSLYFGPFPSAEILDTYLDLVKKIFPLRRCQTMRKRENPCMYYHIGRCSGPCAGKISKEAYAEQVEEIKKLLSGETDALLADLRAKMAAASTGLLFEEAARIRDSITAIELFAGRSSAVDFDPEARDYVAWAADGDLVCYVVFRMRDGKLSGRDLLRGKLYATEGEALQGFLMSYYGAERLPPPKVFVQAFPAAAGEAEGPAEAPPGEAAAEPPPETYPGAAAAASAPELGAAGLDLVAQYFERELGARTDFLLPAERRHEAAMNLATHNAAEDLAKRRREIGDIPALEELRKELGLSSLPTRIEGFDIAQLSGKHTVASLISFKNGVPDKKNYRYFKIRSLEGAIDDFGAVREAVARRYTRLVNEGLDLPDLVLIDGGAGQVSAAREILEALGVDSDLAGLAKQNEEIYLPGRADPVVLPKDSPALRVLVAVRDETHRFATGLNQKLRASELRFGVLEDIEGVGPARARRLMREFGSLEMVAAASVDGLAKVGGMGEELAKRVKERLAEIAASRREDRE